MRYFDILGYEDNDGDRHEFEFPVRDALTSAIADGSADTEFPVGASEVDGLFIHVWDENDPEYHHYFWVYDIGVFDTWEDWADYVEGQMAAHGMVA